MISVSVIIPVFNSAHLIERTVDSVLKQGYEKWEIIIVDDGSSDNIKAVGDNYAQHDKRIKFYSQQNAGASAARNTAIKNASFEWLLFLDADDWIREDYFDKMIPVLENDVSIDVVHCGWARVSKNGLITKENFGGEQEDMFRLLAHYCPFAIHACIVRKKKVDDVGGFATAFKTCGDWDLWQRIARTGAKFKMVKETMAFYHTTPNSLSSNGSQFCVNGLQVISNAYSVDDRVPAPQPEYLSGLKEVDLIKRKYYFITWSAGLLIGSLKPASDLLKHLDGSLAEDLDPEVIAETLIDSVIIPAEKFNWISHWYATEELIKKFLNDLEQQSHCTGLANQSCTCIERHVIIQSVLEIEEKQVGKSVARKLDIEKPLADQHFSSEAERFFGIISLSEKILGLIELPITNKMVQARVIKDAIATKFSWQILQRFFSLTIYPFIKLDTAIVKLHLSEEALHDKIGWVIFLQQLWQKTGWTENMFYNVNAVKKEKAFVINASNSIEIEISEELPAVKTTAATLNVTYYIGGIKAGKCSCPVEKKFVYPQTIRVAIDINAGYELCRLVVREALVGQAIDNGLSLRERLRIAKKPTKDSVTSV